MLNKLKNKKILFSLIFLVAVLFFFIFFITYAYLDAKEIKNSITNVNITSCGEFSFSDTSESISITDAYPMSDNMGRKTTPYSFKIKNTCAITSNFTIYLVIPSESQIVDEYIKYNLDTTSKTEKITALSLALLEPNIKNQIQSKFTYEVKTVYKLTTNSLASQTSKDYNLRLWIDKDAPNDTMDKTFIASLAVIDSKKHQEATFANVILDNNEGSSAITAKGSPDFSLIAETNEGMYAMADDYGTSYYFRGAVDNNWVKFADMYWRIVRVNGDNSVKLIYSGTTAPTESTKAVMTGAGTQIGTQAFNSNYNSAEYVGYMYTLGEQRGLGTASEIKTYLENWYGSNLTSYDNKIADTLFCNDRSTYLGIIMETNYTGNGIGQTGTWFGAARRLISASSWAPIGTGSSLVCPHKDDAFTKADTTKGNGKSDEKIGLLTADEASIAGLGYGLSNINNYLYSNSVYWLGSPFHFYSYSLLAGEFSMDSMGSLGNYYVYGVAGVRPVISLVSDISSSSGDGTWNDPYIVQ